MITRKKVFPNHNPTIIQCRGTLVGFQCGTLEVEFSKTQKIKTELTMIIFCFDIVDLKGVRLRTCSVVRVETIKSLRSQLFGIGMESVPANGISSFYLNL